MEHLISSFKKHLKKIETTGGVWTERTTGSYHTYDEEIVTARKNAIKSEIARLEARNV